MTQRKGVRSLNTKLELDRWHGCLDAVPPATRHYSYETLPSWSGLRRQAGHGLGVLGWENDRISLLGDSMIPGWSRPLLDLNCVSTL